MEPVELHLACSRVRPWCSCSRLMGFALPDVAITGEVTQAATDAGEDGVMLLLASLV